MSDDAGPTKAELRAAALARRDALTAGSREAASAAIARRVLAVLVGAAAPPAHFHRALGSGADPAAFLSVLAAAGHPVAKAVGTYRALGSEADPALILAALAGAGVAIGLATMVDSDTLVFRRYRPGDGGLIPDAYRIPAPPPSAPTVEPDVLIVPVSAFDRRGMRLGKGYGVYDRAIAALRARGRAPLLVGIAFSVQEVAAIPAEAHDARLDWIVTENQTLEFP